jgi:hypothetical protein
MNAFRVVERSLETPGFARPLIAATAKAMLAMLLALEKIEPQRGLSQS